MSTQGLSSSSMHQVQLPCSVIAYEPCTGSRCNEHLIDRSNKQTINKTYKQSMKHTNDQ